MRRLHWENLQALESLWTRWLVANAALWLLACDFESIRAFNFRYFNAERCGAICQKLEVFCDEAASLDVYFWTSDA